MYQTFTVTYKDIPIAVLDKNRQEQYTISKISFEIESDAVPNIEAISSYIYRPEEHLTINEIPMLLLQFRKTNICKSLFFCVDFPYIIRQENRRMSKCDCTFEFHDKPDIAQFYLHLRFRVYQHIQNNKETPIDIHLKILAREFIWIEDIYQIFYDICDVSFQDLESYSSKIMTYFIASNKTKIKTSESITSIVCDGLDASFTSYYNFQKSFTIRKSFESMERLETFPIKKQSKTFENFGVWLKRQRKKRNLQQQELSKLVQVSNSFVSKLESGEKQPSVELIEKLASLWNINLDLLLLKARVITPYIDTITENPEYFLRWVYDMHKADPNSEIEHPQINF